MEMSKEDVLLNFKAILTGSFAYGVPGPKSDIDLVVLMDPVTLEQLRKHSDESRDVSEYGEEGIGCLYFGNMNLIPVCSPGLFEVWRKGTEFLKTKAPVDRDRAVKFLNAKRREWMAANAGRVENFGGENFVV